MSKKKIKQMGTISKIMIWGKMDDVVNAICCNKTLNYWEKNGIPFPKVLKYTDIVMNRYDYEDAFKRYDFEIIVNCFKKCIDRG